VDPIGESDAELPPTTETVWELLQGNFDFYGTQLPGEQS